MFPDFVFWFLQKKNFEIFYAYFLFSLTCDPMGAKFQKTLLLPQITAIFFLNFFSNRPRKVKFGIYLNFNDFLFFLPMVLAIYLFIFFFFFFFGNFEFLIFNSIFFFVCKFQIHHCSQRCTCSKTILFLLQITDKTLSNFKNNFEILTFWFLRFS